MTPRKPTRRDLLVVIGRLQRIVGKAAGLVVNDRAKERAHVVADMLAADQADAKAGKP